MRKLFIALANAYGRFYHLVVHDRLLSCWQGSLSDARIVAFRFHPTLCFAAPHQMNGKGETKIENPLQAKG